MHGIQRQLELDWARGLMLVLMSLTHLPTWFSAQLGQPFGYVSAAEGFVIISGFLVGTIYTRIAQERGVAAMRRLVWRRAGKIYIAHISVLLLLLWVIVPFAVSRDAHPITDLASFYFAHPRRALAGGLLLLYEPPLLDILPMYVLFMLASPLLLTASKRYGWGPLFAGSVALWAMAQFDIGHVLYDAVAGTWGLPLPPYSQTGAFVFLGWQLVWMCGLWGGARSLDPRPPRLPSASVPLAAVVALAFFGWRHWAGQVPAGDAVIVAALDKWHLGALRIVDFAALLVLGVAARRRLAQWARHSLLTTLGKAALPVFCAHLVICFVALAMVADPNPQQLHWHDSALLAATLVALYAVALLFVEGRRLGAPLVATLSARLAARTAR